MSNLCEVCDDKGWTNSFNTATNLDEIQKCDDCNIYSKDSEALKEAEVSIACLMDDLYDITMKDLEHIQNQLQIISGGK